MSTPTYDLIETTTLTSSASSVTFSSITQDYRDLVLVINLSNAENPKVRFNGDSSSTYNAVFMAGDGSSVFSFTPGDTYITSSATSHSANGLFILQVMDYSATDKHKTSLFRTNSTNETFASASRFPSTSAISDIEIFESPGFDSGSTFSLYGIAS